MYKQVFFILFISGLLSNCENPNKSSENKSNIQKKRYKNYVDSVFAYGNEQRTEFEIGLLYCDSALKIKHTAQVFNFKANFQLGMGNINEAIQSYKSAIEIDPIFYQNLANVYIELEDENNARMTIEKSLEYDHDTIKYYCNLSYLNLVMNNQEELDEVYTKAIQIREKDKYNKIDIIIINKIQLLLNKGDTIEACNLLSELNEEVKELEYLKCN